MIRGFFAAALLGLITLGLSAVGLLVILPAFIYRRWRQRMTEVKYG